VLPPLALAMFADLQARTEIKLSPGQETRATVLLTDASARVRQQVPDLPDPPPETAPGVVCTAVLRALASPPDGKTSETVDGHSRTVAHAGGGRYFTDAELEITNTRPGDVRQPREMVGPRRSLPAFCRWTGVTAR
jgi:hypothetical protein